MLLLRRKPDMRTLFFLFACLCGPGMHGRISHVLLSIVFLSVFFFSLVDPCFVALFRFDLSHAWGNVLFCVGRLRWRVLPLVLSGLPCRFAVGIGSSCPWYLFETLLYESCRRKPG